MVMRIRALRHMVESYEATAFGPGDAVQIQDGIVHAGPGCEEQQPRVVIFMTYRPAADIHGWFETISRPFLRAR